MKYYIYRNNTIENLFSNIQAEYSGYDDISEVPDNCNAFIWFYQLPLRFKDELAADEIINYLENIKLILQRIPSSKSFFIFTISKLFYNNMEVGDFRVSEMVAHYNSEIVKLSLKHTNVKIFDFNKFTVNNNYKQLVDWKYYYISGMMINPRLANTFQEWFHNELNAINSIRKKCLILDLDNTLWGGILGEDGVEGIKIGGSYPGNAFTDFQRAILQLKDSGVMLAVCSKNNEKDVLEAWKENKNILINDKVLVNYKINWKNKADNIADMITELNIGADSVVFIDDNPTEREIVKQFIPEIEVPEFPNQAYDLMDFAMAIGRKYFQIYKITNEDKSKTLKYQANSSRNLFKKNFTKFDEYIKSLEIQLLIKSASKITIPRIAQMSQKTNQFNLTTKRYSEDDIRRLIANKYKIYTLEVSDKFGEQGITGLIILQSCKIDQSVSIESLLLSCRVLGKKIEFEFVKFILSKMKKAGYTKAIGKYLESDRNEQVKDFYDKLGFNCFKEEQNDKLEKEYYYSLKNMNIVLSENYKLNENE
jgi:FkbH-like protein